ncbi:hypothetical protein EDB85DRAFT_656751 [Lactarius pseudohatsudake]|nr:hypothetical protein EDB85DRAFT_656751 [Lactarius pseudohatsudake]
MDQLRSATEFCFRGCKDGPNAPALCEHIYDVMGCDWNMPGNYGPGFDQCAGDSGEPMGVYGGSTFHQGDPATPPGHPAPATSSCSTTSSIGNNLAVTGVNSSTSSTPHLLWVALPSPFTWCHRHPGPHLPAPVPPSVELTPTLLYRRPHPRARPA